MYGIISKHSYHLHAVQQGLDVLFSSSVNRDLFWNLRCNLCAILSRYCRFLQNVLNQQNLFPNHNKDYPTMMISSAFIIQHYSAKSSFQINRISLQRSKEPSVKEQLTKSFSFFSSKRLFIDPAIVPYFFLYAQRFNHFMTTLAFIVMTKYQAFSGQNYKLLGYCDHLKREINHIFFSTRISPVWKLSF